jgi:hypothetical protein
MEKELMEIVLKHELKNKNIPFFGDKDMLELKK